MCDSNTSSTGTRKRKANEETGVGDLCVGLLTSRHPLKLRLAMGQYIQEHPGILDLLTNGESTEAFMNSCICRIKASHRKHKDRVYVTADYDGFYGASDHAEGTMRISSLENRRRKARYLIGQHGDEDGEWEDFKSRIEDNYYIVEGNKKESFQWKTGAVVRVEDDSGEEV